MHTELERAICDYQDTVIIHLAMESAIKEGYVIRDEFLPYLEDLNVAESTTKILQKDVNVDFPVLAIDMKTKKLLAFMDPVVVGKPISLQDWLWHWSIFTALQIDDDEYAALDSLAEIVHDCTTQIDSVPCLRTLDRLWQYRWIYNAQTAGDFRETVIRHISSEQEIGAMNLVAPFKEYTEKLRALKEQASSLDDWIEGLFLITPYLWCAMYFNQWIEDEDKKRRERFLSEAFADTGTVFSHLVSNSKDRPEYWTDSFWPKDQPSPNSLRLVRRNMSYYCSARIFYPRFFVNKSLEYFEEGSKGPIPVELNKFNYKHALSCYLSWLPESAISHVIDWDQVRSSEDENV